MKGIVFTEFMEMVEDTFGDDVLEQIIESADLPSGAAYTAVGTYDHHEMLKLVGALSRTADVPAPDLVRTFGRHLFGRFVEMYPKLFTDMGSAFDILSRVEDYIHVEVRKLYPDAELPSFEFRWLDSNRAQMDYRSARNFADLAHGLIAGCAEHYKETIEIRREDLKSETGTAVRFHLSRTGDRTA